MRKGFVLITAYLACLSSSFCLYSSETFYIKNSFVHLNDFIGGDSSYSQTLVCGTPVNLIEQKLTRSKIKYNNEIGYVPTSALSSEPTECFQEKYPKFFQALNIDNSDLFYWGKLK